MESDVQADGFEEPTLRFRQFENDPRKPEWVVELVAMCIGAHLLPLIADSANVGDVRRAFEQAAIAAITEFAGDQSDGGAGDG